MAPRLLHYSDIENACDDPPRIGRLVRAIDHHHTDDTLVVGTGDNTSPGVLPLVTEGRQALEFYDAIDPDVETFGNHDFDYGLEVTREIVRESPQRWLTANVSRNGNRFGADVGVEPWTILERDGLAIGFTGVTTPQTPSINPMAADLVVEEPIDAVRETVGTLRDAGADVVVVCSHLGRGDEKLARRVDIDVVLGGHVPSPRNEVIDGTLLTRPGDGGTAIVEAEFGNDGMPRATIHETAGLDPDPDTARVFRRLQAEAGLDDVVATVENPLDRSETTVFGGEARVGNFVADAYRWATDADVGLQNSGGLRTGSTLTGEVTVADMISLVPFDEPVAVAEVDGATLEAIFDGAAGATLGFAEPDWWHAQVGGVTLEWDRQGHDVSVLSVAGEPVDHERTYRLATSEYLFHTDDEFPALERGDRIEVTDRSQHEILTDYARACGIDPALEGRVRPAADDDPE